MVVRVDEHAAASLMNSVSDSTTGTPPQRRPHIEVVGRKALS